MAFTKAAAETTVSIKPANIVRARVRIVGTAPYMQNKFSHKAKLKMMADMETPANQKKARSARTARNYDDDFLQAQHISSEGWNGIPCPAFRAAMVDACRVAGAVMTKAKMSVFVIPDGFDRDDATPLVKIISGPPKRHEGLVRNSNGSADVRIRPIWHEWEANVLLEYDADQMTGESVVNLLDRAGRQIGIGEGRPFSKDSVGLGLGTFMVVPQGE
ncbi:MAG: hypothetical protein HQL90_04365 [Magnetococcales bacterium]|nr:hypothetical protein [Magnetococcales bacterium]